MSHSSDHPLNKATDLCRAALRDVDACIRRELDSDVMMIPAIGNYIVDSGGKRLRPLLCLLSARLFGYRGERHIPLSVVVEFLHTASLLHDDVVDSSDVRRGTPSANGVWGNQASVLVGDFLFSRAFEMMVADGHLDVLALLSKVSNTLAEGEVLQLVRTFHLQMTEAQYLEVVESKTAILFSAAAEIGARVSEENEQTITRMAEYGMCLGVAFQLMDDVLDYAAEADAVGKPVGHDLEEGKITLPLIHAMAQNAELYAIVEGIAERGCYADGERKKVRDTVLSVGGVERCLAAAQEYAERAKRALPETGNREIGQLMAELADFSARRTH
ncbi:MAG: polyprenyl synthetase family protein [Mariprofundaceae bacterium]|nr:polyprenyl synthetase family protein [Mariprofundaceae bacterium]